MAIITISRQMASFGDEIARAVAERLDHALVDRTALVAAMARRGMTDAQAARLAERSPAFLDAIRPHLPRYLALLQQEIEQMAEQGNVVVVGHGGNFILRQHPAAFHVKVVASWPTRIARIVAAGQADEEAAAALLGRSDRDRAGYVRFFYGGDWMDPTLYDLVINTDFLEPGAAAELVVHGVERLDQTARARNLAPAAEPGAGPRPLRAGGPAGAAGQKPPAAERPAFTHPSEQEFAGVLDFYGVRWLYEPRTFPLAWDEQGNVTEALTPDFYLPDLDLYIELTTMKQSLVTRKNAKLKRLRKLYPEVNIKLFYGRDYMNLLRKYGRD